MSDPFKFPPSFDMLKIMGTFRWDALPELEGVMAAQRRNLEALAEAGRLAFEGAQAAARRQIEISQRSLSEIIEALRLATSAEEPQVSAAKQIDFAKACYERAMADLREMTALLSKTHADALAVLERRIAEALEEAKTLFAKKG